MATQLHLKDMFNSRYQLRNLRGVSAELFQAHLKEKIGAVSGSSEGFVDESKQRDLSLKFHWGHNHDFGSGLSLAGRMADRHLDIVAEFIDDYGLPKNLTGKKILDIGVWTGGTSLLLAGLGAQVVALEEVVKYADMVNYLAASFGLDSKLRCYPKSLYEFLPRFADEFDFILYSGVIYHVTDPILSLRLIFSALKDGGSVFVETFGLDAAESVARYEGPAIVHSGSRKNLDSGGWNYFVPSPKCLEMWCRDAGFQKVNIGKYLQTRIKGSAQRTHFEEFCRAGLSQVNCR
jgi:2-polyprenyl-3-methyl-5-hydroxy-6-metoxy-1,4-benzoquinol methylase